MQVVADTNTVVSGLLWRGAPRQVLDAAHAGRMRLYTCGGLLAELEDVLKREKFADRLRRAGVSAKDLVWGYAALCTLVRPGVIAHVIADDPDDDLLLACALAAQAERIVSGDRHLLNLGEYQGIVIVTAENLLHQLPK